MRINKLILSATSVITILALAFLSSCDLANQLVVTLPTQTINPAGFQLRPAAPNSTYTDTATVNPNAIYQAIISQKYDTADYTVKSVTVNKITIKAPDSTQIGALCKYMKLKISGADIATTTDSYDSTATSITLTPINGNTFESVLQQLNSSPIIFECGTSDLGVNETHSLSLDVDVIIELDPND